VGKPATAEEQEALFQAILHKMATVDHPDRLVEVATLALALMLRRPGDHNLKAELTNRIHVIVSAIKQGQDPEAMRNQMHAAARACVQVLQTAKERRLPRPVPDNWAQAKTPAKRAPRARQVEEPELKSRAKQIWIGASLAVAAVVLYLMWSSFRETPGPDGSETSRFVEQIIQAAQGNAPPTHIFGGALRTGTMGGIPVVTAEGVPPGICSASGMRLVRKGLLSVNGVTPTRVSSAIITELCNRENGNAIMQWAPTK